MRPEDFSFPEKRSWPQTDISFKLPVLQHQVHSITSEPSLIIKQPVSQFPSSKHPLEEIEERDEGKKSEFAFFAFVQ
jgi:hypothetical protein